MKNINKNIAIAVKISKLHDTANEVLENLLRQARAEMAQADDKQAVLDVFGENAARMFNTFNAYSNALAQTGSADVSPTSGNYTVNQDGTITYTEPEPESESTDIGDVAPGDGVT